MKAKSFFFIFIGMAAVPLALAYATLKLGWYTPGATAKGEFVDREIVLDIHQKQQQTLPHWYLVAQPEKACEAECQELLYGLNQTYVALGKLQKRVETKVFSAEVDLTKFPKLQNTDLSSDSLSSRFIYVVDPFGKVVLQYPVSADRDQTITSSKAILADLKKLLKYSRVG